MRLVHGRPGVGKTTVLWKAVEARNGQRVLYLRWSRELTAAAEEHFRAFAPSDVRMEARDFATFLGELCGTDVARLPLSESLALFAAATARLGRKQARTVGEPRRRCACRGAGDAARPRRARRHRLHPGRRPGTAERRHVPRPAGGPRRCRPGGGERAAQGGRTRRTRSDGQHLSRAGRRDGGYRSPAGRRVAGRARRVRPRRRRRGPGPDCWRPPWSSSCAWRARADGDMRPGCWRPATTARPYARRGRV